MTDTTQLRTTLLERADVPNDDIDDVIAIAQELQDAQRAEADGASLADVQDVARELDIDPAYVEQALTELTRRREEAQEADEAQAEAAAAQRAAVGRAAGVGLAGLLGLLVLAMLWVGTAVPGLRTASLEVATAEAQLDAVLDRQAGLAPQLVSLAGGDARGLQSHLDAVRSAPDVQAKLQASDALGAAMAERIAQLKPTDEASQQLRLNLQYEITGSTNRVATERARYERARVAYEQRSHGLRATVARTMGLVD
jgi:LemA protein